MANSARSRTGVLLANVAALLSLVISSQAQFEARSVSEASSALTAVVGDFNRDGTPDLAVINGLPTTGGVGILLGNGDGTFRAGANYIFGIFPLYGATASLRKNG
ncbi:MAG TPA: VCBS repeat-containing protein, partial [Candidatus Binatia bacterium]|nr:VCBS repeat-containing protein [Candidatus Binatia bacterium]